jgi:Flp pilus assembly protein TadB
MDAVRPILVLIHAGVAALWLGSMAYSLFVVQPKLSRMAGGDPEKVEDLHRELAQGNRWPVVGLIATLWVTGALLTQRLTFPVSLKAMALLVATALFYWVSWRAWPRRVFALPQELPALQRQFRRVAIAMFGLVGLAFALGFLF